MYPFACAIVKIKKAPYIGVCFKLESGGGITFLGRLGGGVCLGAFFGALWRLALKL